MVDRKISRVRLRDLARLGRSRTGCAALQAAPPAHPLRAAGPRAASSRPEEGDLFRSTI